jgi:glucose-6-phosphate isomerase
MLTLHLDGLFVGGDGFSPADFDRYAPTLEGLRRVLLAQAKDPGHFLAHIPPDEAALERIRAAARELRREAETLVVCGIGGSSLGGRVLCGGVPGVIFLEGVDPRTVARTLRSVDWSRAALNIISKSGGTLETLVNAGLCLEALRKAHPETWRRRIVVTASSGDGRLQTWAAAEGVTVLSLPGPVGGRYSVLTAVGFLPAAFQGTDPSALVAGAHAGADRALLLPGRENPALALALALISFFGSGRPEVDLWGYGERGYTFALWVQQLWGESLGRRIEGSGGVRHVGSTPLACRGSEDQHSLLQLFLDGPPTRWVLMVTGAEPGPALSREVRGFAGLPDRVVQLGQVQEALWEGTARGLTEARVPVARYDLGAADARSLAEALFVFQVATLYAAALLEVDPFGQPGVEAGKRHTRARLEGR